MTHQRVVGHVGQRAPRRSPDFEIGLAETGRRLADFEISMKLQQLKDHAAGALRRRYSVGVTPVMALKARLNGPSDWKPASIAMVMTGTSTCVGSDSAVLASSMRWLLRKTL